MNSEVLSSSGSLKSSGSLQDAASKGSAPAAFLSVASTKADYAASVSLPPLADALSTLPSQRFSKLVHRIFDELVYPLFPIASDAVKIASAADAAEASNEAESKVGPLIKHFNMEFRINGCYSLNLAWLFFRKNQSPLIPRRPLRSPPCLAALWLAWCRPLCLRARASGRTQPHSLSSSLLSSAWHPAPWPAPPTQPHQHQPQHQPQHPSWVSLRRPLRRRGWQLPKLAASSVSRMHSTPSSSAVCWPPCCRDQQQAPRAPQPHQSTSLASGQPPRCLRWWRRIAS